MPQPQFPGGVDGLNKYLKDNYKWTQRQLTVEGTVYVGFLITKDGSVARPSIVRGLCVSCDKEALRLISNMPKWEPVIIDGKATEERFILPIKFGLTNPYE